MLKAKTRWKVNEVPKQVVAHLQSELSVSALTARLLVQRGIQTKEEAERFLQPTLFSFHDPFLMDGMDIAVKRIKSAVEKHERILIFGDYDADGITSTAIMVYVLRELRANFMTYIPNRFTEGYGPNEAVFRWAKQQGVHLIVTVDTGIAAVYEAKIAKELGMDVIVTDHHEVPPTLPDAYAIVNPKKPGCPYPFKGLSGAGIALKLAHALFGKAPLHLLDLAAIGTIADLVPLKDENRKIVSEGLVLMARKEKPGIKALLDVSGLKGEELSAEQIGFTIAPRINAAGRLDSADPALKLLTSDNEEEAKPLAEEMNRFNQKRQEIVNDITEEAVALVEESGMKDRVIVVVKEGWNSGVIGIVASRLVERYNRPAVVLSIDSDTGVAKGSARSIEAFDLFANLAACRDLLPHFGGHQMAAGLSIDRRHIGELRKRLNQLAAEKLTDEDFIPLTIIDAVCSLSDINIETIEEISRFVPFGVDNPVPKILLEHVTLSDVKQIGIESNHLKLLFKDSDVSLEGIGFNCGDLYHELNPDVDVDVVGELSINEWNGFRKPQLKLCDLAVNEWQLFDLRGVRDVASRLKALPKNKVGLVAFREETIDSLQLNDWENNVIKPENGQVPLENIESMYLVLLDLPYSEKQFKDWYRSLPTPERTYAVFHHMEEHFFTSVPSREQFKQYYALLLKRKMISFKQAVEFERMKGWAKGTVRFMSKVFFELEFVTINSDTISVLPHPNKKDLSLSKSYRQKYEMIQLEKTLIYSSYHSLKRWFKEINHSPNVEEAIH